MILFNEELKNIFRYFEEKGVRSKSLDNLIEPTNTFGLSESKLNQRYLSHTVNEGDQVCYNLDPILKGLLQIVVCDIFWSILNPPHLM